MADKQRKAGGAKKIGRNGAACKVYRSRGVREKNKRLKMERHSRHFPNDLQVKHAMRSIEARRINKLIKQGGIE